LEGFSVGIERLENWKIEKLGRVGRLGRFKSWKVDRLELED
jgi:hypothetical protein